MTCHDALALLEDYVDKELAADKDEAIKEHLAGCPDCREEFEATILLKEMLKQNKPADPGKEYWSETTGLIKARTTESHFREDVIVSLNDRRAMERGAFIRSLVSVAASLVVLFSALTLGSNQHQRLAQITASEPPVFAAASLDELVGTDNTIIVTQDEKVRQARGMLLMGAPGMLGRFVVPYDITPKNY